MIAGAFAGVIALILGLNAIANPGPFAPSFRHKRLDSSLASRSRPHRFVVAQLLLSSFKSAGVI
jgi:hypothetical protein